METYRKSRNLMFLFGMRTATLSAVLALVLWGASIAVAGPISEYYLTAGDQFQNHAVQGSNVNQTWQQVGNDKEYAIAVPGTIRTLGIGPVGGGSGQGSEYALDGTPTGTTYSYSLAGGIYDGTTDGTYNYTWGFQSNIAYRFNLDWTNPIQLFTLGISSGRRLGITYDPTNDSLWLSGWSGTVGNTVENRAMDGTLLSSFTLGHNRIAALALDHADGTLWLHDRNTLNTSALVFEQYSRDGLLLSSQSYPSLSGQNILGGEFLIPEPATMCLLGLGGLAALRRKRKATK